MKVFRDRCEIALSDADLRRALGLWVERMTACMQGDYEIEKHSVHPGNKYVVRMVVKPPSVAKEIAEAAVSDQNETAK